MSRRKRPTDETGDAEILRLNNQLCFALYAATRAITKVYREKLDDLGLTYPQYLVLIVLWETDGLSISDIGSRLMLDSGTVTPVVQRLERQKLVRRERSSDDERQVHAHLTDKGRSLMAGAGDARRYVACRLGMSEIEIAALRADLMSLVRQLGTDGATLPAATAPRRGQRTR